MSSVEVLISRRAAAALFGEVRRWVERGLRSGGMPLESMLYPLAALVPRAGLATPLELVGLDSIRELVIDAVAIPPDEVKAFSPHNCHFSARDIARANLEFNAAIDSLILGSPRLAVLSKLHSHPFPGGAFLSTGDRYHGVTAPEAVQWRHRRGLSTALLHVAYPDGEPGPSPGPWRLVRDGAVAGAITWRIHTWGSLDGGTLRDLGDARIVSGRHPSVAAARRLPYWATRRGATWCDAQKTELRAAGFRVSRNVAGRGWRRYLVESAGGQIVIGLPPDLPRAAPRVLRIDSAIHNAFTPLGVPPALTPPSLARLSLLRLVRTVEGT